MYWAQPPAFIELAWDTLGAEFETQMTELITWHQGVWRFRYSQDWGAVVASVWVILKDKANARHRTQVKILAEATKFEFYSADLNAQLDRLAYRADPKTAPSRTDQ